eukprot:jgi/Botrbrau1/19860/Bobra.0549s0001.1
MERACLAWRSEGLQLEALVTVIPASKFQLNKSHKNSISDNLLFPGCFDRKLVRLGRSIMTTSSRILVPSLDHQAVHELQQLINEHFP